jgi:hypothetical protein
MKLKPIVTIICLAAGGIAAMHYGYDTIAATCFGAIAGWGFLNGVANELKKTNKEAEG